MGRSYDRASDSLRPVTLTRRYLRHAHGSCLFELGDTKVLCAATFAESVAGWRRGSGKGWVTAEYSLLPASTHTRTRREVSAGAPSGRTHEIQRLIGRSLRTVVDMRSIPLMRETGCPVVFDATHSVQLPGGKGASSGGDRRFVRALARAAVAAGADGVFFEVHPDPEKALCDPDTQITPGDLDSLLGTLLAIKNNAEQGDRIK